jgi:NAD(P)H-dependent FMN reductase
LRAASINSMLLRAASRLAPADLQVRLFRAAGELPLFNPDLEAHLPEQVATLHADVGASDALLIASPEYAHGVTGTMKNVLDWLVGCEAFVNKPVAIFNSSPRAHHADDALREILKTMCAVIVPEASVSLPLLGAGLTEDAIVNDRAISDVVRGALAALQRAVAHPPREPGSSVPWP